MFGEVSWAGKNIWVGELDVLIKEPYEDVNITG